MVSIKIKEVGIVSTLNH